MSDRKEFKYHEVDFYVKPDSLIIAIKDDDQEGSPTVAAVPLTPAKLSSLIMRLQNQLDYFIQHGIPEDK